MALYIASGDGGDGGGEAFRVPTGAGKPGVLAEVIDLGERQYDGKGKKRQAARLIFVMPEELIGDDGPESMHGQPKLIYQYLNHVRFGNYDNPDYWTDYEWWLSAANGGRRIMKKWQVVDLPDGTKEGFCLGRELGTGPKQWDPSLEGEALKQQRMTKPGVPIGMAFTLKILHVEAGDKVHCNPAKSHFPVKEDDYKAMGKTAAEYAEEASKWTPGVGPADDNAKRYTFNAEHVLLCDGKPWEGPKGGYTYVHEAARKQAREGGNSAQASPVTTGPLAVAPEDDDIPF